MWSRIKATLLSSTLSILRRIRKRGLQAVPYVARNFYTVSARPGHERNLMEPDFTADCRDGVAESENGLCIPSCRSGLEVSLFVKVVRQESDDRVQGKQCRGGAKDCIVRPLALSFHAKVRANFLKCHLDIPSGNKPSNNVSWAGA